jgi:hypothetical protein
MVVLPTKTKPKKFRNEFKAISEHICLLCLLRYITVIYLLTSHNLNVDEFSFRIPIVDGLLTFCSLMTVSEVQWVM